MYCCTARFYFLESVNFDIRTNAIYPPSPVGVDVCLEAEIAHALLLLAHSKIIELLVKSTIAQLTF